MPDSHNDLESGRLNLDIPIFQKAYELYKLLYQYVASFPKKDRYTLGQRVENSLLDFMESIILASQLSKTDKLPVLQKASIKLDVLKVFIRLCKDLKILDNKKYLILESQIQEIGRMLGGWIKAST
jgi:four helix bundle protein